MSYSVEAIERNGFAGVELRDDSSLSSARLTWFGFNVFSWRVPSRVGSVELIDAEPAFPGTATRPVGSGSPILAPFPNRIANGKFQFDGKSYQLTCNEANGQHAIHGFVADAVWRPVDQGGGTLPTHLREQLPSHLKIDQAAWVSAVFQLSIDQPAELPNWPGDFKLSATCLLSQTQLVCLFEVINVDTVRIPFGLGTHAYFRFPLTSKSSEADCSICVPGNQLVELESCLPTGKLLPVSTAKDLRMPTSWAGKHLDDIYTQLTISEHNSVEHWLIDGQASLTLRLSHGREFAYAVVYLPGHRRAICIEPYTCLTDAINSADPQAAGLIILEPGERRRFWLSQLVEDLL